MAILNMRVKVSEPKPAFCSACHKGATVDVKFIDFQAAHDSGMHIEERDGIVLKRMPGDDLHLCESCVRQAAEALGLKPGLHARQAAEIGQLKRRGDHWKAYAERLEASVQQRPEPARGARRA